MPRWRPSPTLSARAEWPSLGTPATRHRNHRIHRNSSGEGFCGLCCFCGAWQRVDQEPRRGGAATTAGVPGGLRVDPAQVAMLLEQPEGWLEVGGLGEPAAGGGQMGVAAAEL